ncbi:signal peptidase [Sediminihabitans luteus]|uniref:Signal peptidase I n=1 Tax=Sediminihabitans luteus TaxID=1138585 RepID=A0A2M9CCX6_9CELL|nr:signal peptidase I [Sediminihabitans luteus]PJJ69210.1 signal peptidase [Sediminihabitans luteus]GII98885.1 signal peptidase I W [Sediminihabitans luteus]
MRRALRVVGNVTLWVVAVLGVLSGVVWAATAAGWIQPLVVISGSMEPTISTGDLLIDRPTDTDGVEVGDVVSLPSDLTGEIVTHRVVEIDHHDDGGAEIRMQGDANPAEDIAPYEVGDEVLHPVWQIDGAGYWVVRIQQPSVAIPLLVTVLALVGLSLIGPARKEDPA